jgi:HlyD family secretion protein
MLRGFIIMNSKYRKKLAIAAFIFSVVLLAGCGVKKPGPRGPRSYEFTEVRRRTLERTVSSSGTIHPVSTVNVLPRMSGKVEKINVDYNDTVRKGDILAELNTDVLRLKREQQYASVIKARASYELQRINYTNQQALAEKNLISSYELRTSKTTLDGQAADLAVAEANLKEIETEINQYAYITSPIDGIVLDRNITVGDTVVDSSSNNSSKIFVLAENLDEMQIEAIVGELDITSIHKGQSVKFTLESLPGRTFTGEVETLRMVPVVSNNVVSYTVIIKVENYDGALMPGMTCAVDFIVERNENVLAISNAALRYQPTSLSAEQIEDMVFNAGLLRMDEEQRQAALAAREQAKAASPGQSQNQGAGLAELVLGGNSGGRQMNFGVRGQGGQTRQGGAQTGRDNRGSSRELIIMRNLWYINGEGKLEMIRVQTGISNGSLTEIITEEDLEGKQFILREKV